MIRNLWVQAITVDKCPPWKCPVCKQNTVRLEPGSLQSKEDVFSRNYRKHDDWEPEWISYTFVAWAKCTGHSCSQDFAISGTGRVKPTYDEEGQNWEDAFSPNQCNPMPEIIELPAKCPSDVVGHLGAAFVTFWADRPSCAGRIRSALESLLTHQGIPTQTITKKGDLVNVALHSRIEQYIAREPVLGNHLMALKWLGNTGSHGSRIIRDDLLDAFEVLEHSLSEIVDNKSKNIEKLAKKLALKHDPKQKLNAKSLTGKLVP